MVLQMATGGDKSSEETMSGEFSYEFGDVAEEDRSKIPSFIFTELKSQTQITKRR